MGTADTVERFVLSAATWEAIERPDAGMVGRYCLGVDLGASASMSALAGYWPDTGALRVLGMFPENPNLVERGLSDGVGELYTRAAALGELHTGGDEISDVEALLTLAFEYWGQPSAGLCATTGGKPNSGNLYGLPTSRMFPLNSGAWVGRMGRKT